MAISTAFTAAVSDRYRVERELGQGGMATVYLAQDLKHDRRVALKVLRPELAAVIGAERFLQEIRTTANLQHPHILPLFDSGVAGSFLFYVMPYLEGESLRDRLSRHKELGIEEALEIARRVASALDYAHRHNVLHRDIKPENILLHDGQPVVADFGIALAVSHAGGTRLTETGLSVGTPRYMSPEQAMGDRELDARTDVYSLACTLYEMLVGDPPFLGSTAQAIVAKIITERPTPVSARRDTVPGNVSDAIQRALAKLPADRFGTAVEFAEALVTPTGARHSGARVAFAEGAKPRRLSLVIAAGVGAAAAVALLLPALLRSGASSEPSVERHLSILLPDSAPVALAGPAPLGIWQRSLAISRDGSTVVYVAAAGGTTRLFVRRLDGLDARELFGTEGAYSPFFSPDGQWIGFFAGLQLKKVQVSGGQPTTIQDVLVPTGASWPEDERIIVASNEGRHMTWVPSSGGTPARVDTLPSTVFNAFSLLPGGRAAVGNDQFGLLLATFDPIDVLALTRGGPSPIGSVAPADQLAGFNPVYSPTGHLLYASAGDGQLLALPFDAERLEVLGDPVPVLEGVRKEQTYGFAQFAVAEDGTLAYVPGGNGDLGRLAFVNAQREVDTLPFDRAVYSSVILSPNGRQIAARISRPGGRVEPVLLDLDGSPPQTIRPDVELGRLLRFLSSGEILALQAPPNRLDANGTMGFLSPLTGAWRGLGVVSGYWSDISPAGDLLAILTSVFDTQASVRRLAGDTAAMRLPEGVDHLRFSPDGRWLAYSRPDASVAVTPVPPTGQAYQVSTGFGEVPMWSAAGDVLYYRFGRRIWAVDVETNGGFRASPPRLAAEGPFVRVFGRSYDIAPDGRILVVMGSPEVSADRIDVITGFSSRLSRLAPAN